MVVEKRSEKGNTGEWTKNELEWRIAIKNPPLQAERVLYVVSNRYSPIKLNL